MTTITLPRAVVEQALGALKNFERFRQMMSDGPDASDKLLAEDYAEMAFVQGFQSITKLEAALAQQAEPVEQTCTWQQDGDSDSGVYGTSCGHYFQIEDGTPADNKMAWCCYCGKKLAQELIAENEDE